jgi:hypothetical protein
LSLAQPGPRVLEADLNCSESTGLRAGSDPVIRQCRALRGSALGRKSGLFAGSDRGGERAAVMCTLIQTAARGRHRRGHTFYGIENIHTL